MYRNYLNIPEEIRDQAIYRIMPIERLIEVFYCEKLSLVRPKMWDDPFENWLLKSYGLTPEGDRVNLTNIRDAIYGQCWTFHRETDAMWRIYSHAKQGAKVKTTIRKLLESLYSSTDDFPELSCFIGKVHYLTVEDMKQKLTTHDFFDSTGAGTAETLLFKRDSFEHENEVRLIFHFPESNKATNDIHQFQINPRELFDEIVLDPRIGEDIFQSKRNALKDKGFSKSIEQSELYRPPEELIIEWV